MFIRSYLTFLLILLVFGFIRAYAQQFTVSGRIIDESTKEGIMFSNILVKNSNLGTGANKEGYYNLKLSSGKYKIIVSSIGYISDTLEILVNENLTNINFELIPSPVTLGEIIVMPGENPANEIIRNAIKIKKQREKKIVTYRFNAYTKAIVRSSSDVTASDNTVVLGVDMKDTSQLKINGILENQSEGYYKQPDKYKEIVLARKQTANFPSTVNILTGGRMIQNFYSDDVKFFGSKIKSPLSDDALSYYYFQIEDTLSIDNQNIFQIQMTPDNPIDPGFVGKIFISGNDFNLVKVDLQLNRAANFGGLLDTVKIIQNFFSYSDSIYMPVDYHLDVTANLLGIVKIGFEFNSILYDYNINVPLKDDIFGKAVLTVMTDADKKDSVYWSNSQTLANTSEEIEAYTKIDSISKVPKTFWDEFSLLSNKMRIYNGLSISAPLALYHFNRVEGHAVDFGLFLDGLFEQRLNSSLKMSYGFADRKNKYEFHSEYLLGNYRTFKIEFNTFQKLSTLFSEENSYSELTTTLFALLSKEDFNDYYYSNGIHFKIGGEIFPVLSLHTGFINRIDKSASINTNFSFFAKNRDYRINPQIYESKLNIFSIGFTLDFRDYIEDGLFRRRVGTFGDQITIEGNLINSNKGIFKSDLDFTTFTLQIKGQINTFHSTMLNFKFYSFYNNGKLPYQMLFPIPGNVNLTARNFTFRTLEFNEYLADRVATASLEYKFGSELFRLLGISFLVKRDMHLSFFINAAYSDLSNSSKEILIYPVKTFKNVFYETGFGIGHLLSPLKFEFAWKLNHKGKNNFRYAINTTFSL